VATDLKTNMQISKDVLLHFLFNLIARTYAPL